MSNRLRDRARARHVAVEVPYVTVENLASFYQSFTSEDAANVGSKGSQITRILKYAGTAGTIDTPNTTSTARPSGPAGVGQPMIWDGSNDYAFSTAGWVIAQPFTLVWRVRVDAFTAGNVLLASADDAVKLLLDSSPAIKADAGTLSAGVNVQGAGTWQTIVLVANGASSQLGNPGALSAVSIGAGAFAGANLGKDTGGNFAGMSWGASAVWNAALSPSRITEAVAYVEGIAPA